MAEFVVSWDSAGFEQLALELENINARVAGMVRDRAKENIRDAGLVDTGTMMNNVHVERIETATRQIVSHRVVVDTPYAIYQHEGTRDHGPKTAKILRFKPRGGKGYVFAKHVRGVKAHPFLTDALNTIRASDW